MSDGQFSYGRVLAEPLNAFYDFVSESEADAETVLSQPVKYTLLVMNNAVTSGRWRVISQADLDADLQKPVRFFKQHLISGELSININGESFPATVQDCIGLECNAVWDAEHVEDRILDEIKGRPNKWVESLKLKLN
ncbi:Imm26 family immunity protein [Labrenzia sp. R4_2]|uniref:Imm26 family immunity protein n=1 Tax=Labrenzia sp. R4_2 TaxID=2821107 RepID=UPI0025707214|nr:Imm26 family immunity protein [Labrenzia sp. R4_2]